MPYNTTGRVNLIIFNNVRYVESINEKMAVFISDYDNKILFRVKEDVNVIIPEEADSTVEFSLPVTLDFNGESHELSFKKVDSSGNYEDIDISGKSSHPPLSCIGMPANSDILNTASTFLRSDDIIDAIVGNTDSSEGGSTNSATLIGLGTAIVIILALIIAILTRAIRKKKEAPAKVELIPEME